MTELSGQMSRELFTMNGKVSDTMQIVHFPPGNHGTLLHYRKASRVELESFIQLNHDAFGRNAKALAA